MEIRWISAISELSKVEKIPLHFSVKKKNTFWRINFLIEKNVEFSVAKISYLAGLPNAPPVSAFLAKDRW